MKALAYNWTQDKKDWNHWDEFLQDNPRGIYLQSSLWLESYLSYGFAAELLLAKNEAGEIIGGMGVVLAGKGPIKVLIAPYGPILSHGYEEIAQVFISYFQDKAKSKGSVFAQIAVPIINQEGYTGKHLLPFELGEKIFAAAEEGLIFKYVAGLSGFRAVRLFPSDPDAYEKVRSNYKSATRRDVNKSGRVGNELCFAVTESQIHEAYKLIELNAQNQGYSVRSWNDFGPTLKGMIEKKQCFIACCKNGEKLKGALIIFEIGRKLHYIMGATLREKKDLMVGHFLQDQIIQLGIQKGYDFYDISMGGSEGVVKFKEGFGGDIVEIIAPRYWVLKPVYFKFYQKIMPWIQRNKAFLSTLLSKMK